MKITTRIESALYVHDSLHLSLHEEFKLFGEYEVEDYLHGRCHLMALAIAEMTGLKCAVMLDMEAGYNEENEPITTLEHAFCEMDDELNSYVADARGVRHRAEIESEYDQAFSPELVVGDEAKDLIIGWIALGLLEDYLPGERDALILHIVELQSYPWLTLLTEDSAWHDHKISTHEIKDSISHCL